MEDREIPDEAREKIVSNTGAVIVVKAISIPKNILDAMEASYLKGVSENDLHT